MNDTSRTSSIASVVVAVAIAAAFGAACGPADDGTTAAQPVATTETTIDRTPTHATNAVAYEQDVLYVGGVPLRQFPRYREDDVFKPPRGWMVLNPTRKPTQTDITIVSSDDLFEQPRATAIIVRQNQMATDQTETGLLAAEEAAGLQDASVVTESSVKGPDRICYFRVKAGDVRGDRENGSGYSATIIAAGTARPSAAVWVRGGVEDAPEGARLAREIAEALCAPPAVSS